ncbi:MAG: hypothetical protein AB7Q97_24220 [Gammaproteobacteria bacterium]
MENQILARIEASIAALANEVARISARVDALQGTKGTDRRAQTLQFLDEYRAAETGGAQAFGAWAASCTIDCLRGGLRMIELREAAHAQLLEARLRELGGVPTCPTVTEANREFLETMCSATVSDVDKLRYFGRIASPEAVIRSLSEKADRIDDEETQFIVRAIIDDERTTLTFLEQACRQLAA